MKKKYSISYLSHAFIAMAAMGAVSSCVEESEFLGQASRYGEGLTVQPVVSDATLATRATESDEALNEKKLQTLDVFVQHIADGTPETGFLRQYHLTSSILEKDLNLLAEKWRAEGLKVGENYNIYVAANNRLTTTDVASVEALKALKFDEVELGLAKKQDNKLIWADEDAQPKGQIFKTYAAGTESRATTPDKIFMMDGVIQNWTPNPNTLDQVFDVTLNRAAAKVVLNAKFDTDFLKSLAYEKDADDNYTIEKADKDKIIITGSPAWKFFNFAFDAPVFAPETSTAASQVLFSDFNIIHSPGFAADEDKDFQIVTYTYPNKWETANYINNVPSLTVSIGFSHYKNFDAEGKAIITGEASNDYVTNYHYYRIPIVKNTVTKIERNHIYVINATIATLGSELHEDEDVIEDVEYAVLPWNDQTNSDVINNEVEAVQHYYLKVNPKVYTLRGDDQPSVDINYLKAAGTSVKWQLYSFDTTTQTKGAAVEPTAYNAVWGWYYDGDGNMKTSYSGMTYMGVTISQSDEGTNGTSGKITVTSTDLPNRAIKYMLLRVYLNEKQTLYEDVIIRHFPTDNIQSIKGLWSSRTSTGWWSYWNGLNSNGYKNDDDAGNSSTQSNLFDAAYYNYNNGYVYFYKREGYGGYWDNSSLRNNNKYVIQISSTSDLYVLGRPYLDGNKQSNDHVVSPAFMIASQLGATSSKSPGYYNGYYYDLEDEIPTYARAAANHCATYKEVDSDSTEWTDWRLPTREEVGVILRYQHARYDTMDPVLTGQFYWTLEGEAVATGVLSQDNNGTYNLATNWDSRYSDSSYDYPGRYGDGVSNRACYIRCIRDMSASEIESLNGFKKIIDQYQNK